MDICKFRKNNVSLRYLLLQSIFHLCLISTLCTYILCNPLVAEDSLLRAPQSTRNKVLVTTVPPKVSSTTKKPRVESSRQLVPTLKIDREAQGNSGSEKKKKKVDITQWFKEEIDDYPEDEIKLILKKTSNDLKELYNVLNTPLDPYGNLSERTAHHSEDDSIEYGTREESVCRIVLRNIYPREANRDNARVYVPNTQEFMQVIQAEICQDPDQECSYLKDSLPYGMTSWCQQKYAYKKLLFLDPLEKRMASDMFRYPSCCSCYVKTSSSFDLRSAMNQSSSALKPTTIEQPDKTISSHESSLSPKKLDVIREKSSINDENDEISSPTLISTTPSTDSNKLSRISRTTTTATPKSRTAKQIKQTTQTVVLHEDKVYTANSERR